MMAALRTQNARLVQSMFVFVFPVLYLTTSQAPMDLLPPIMQTIAKINPVTYIIEGVRALVLDSWGNPAVWQGFLVAASLFVIMTSFTLVSFQKALK